MCLMGGFMHLYNICLANEHFFVTIEEGILSSKYIVISQNQSCVLFHFNPIISFLNFANPYNFTTGTLCALRVIWKS